VVRRSLAILVGAAVLLGAACGDDDDDTAADDTPPATDEPSDDDDGGGVNPLDGRTFIATEVTEGGQPRPLVEGTELSVVFGPENQISVSAGCNSMSGPAEFGGGTIQTAGLATTEMGCDEARHAQDEWIAGLLSQGLGYTLDGDELTLTAGNTVIVLTDRETVNPDRPLEETVWQLDGIVEGDGVSSVPVGASATVVFRGGEVVVENEGCNGARGPAEVAESEITVGPLMMTKMGCEPDPAAVEAALTQVLDGTITYTVEADRLDLSNPNGTGLTFVAKS
jgi:heat shock protein HslJ